MKIDRSVKEHGWCDGEATGAVRHDAAEIAGFPDNRGISGAVKPVIHFFHKAGNAASQNLYGDRIGFLHRLCRNVLKFVLILSEIASAFAPFLLLTRPKYRVWKIAPCGANKGPFFRA
jgi:hypothetical protein